MNNDERCVTKSKIQATLDEARYESVLGTDPGTQLPYMQGSVEITRQEVELGSHLEEFACQCYASGASDSHVVRSDPARIRIAYPPE
ncbi:hypothetical protein ANCDUO_15855 [Ancylostoma duodenale]|uniref:Uncharacterized protein n=1 Tax=Ancylostoma duodenale TaxID=51022 RepID=A0A0C2FZG6_9BILA|nr:hypothetical protein ANCDUO_15855 [Ancylostoma duodenale]